MRAAALLAVVTIAACAAPSYSLRRSALDGLERSMPAPTRLPSGSRTVGQYEVELHRLAGPSQSPGFHARILVAGRERDALTIYDEELRPTPDEEAFADEAAAIAVRSYLREHAALAAVRSDGSPVWLRASVVTSVGDRGHDPVPVTVQPRARALWALVPLLAGAAFITGGAVLLNDRVAPTSPLGDIYNLEVESLGISLVIIGAAAELCAAILAATLSRESVTTTLPDDASDVVRFP